MAISFPVLSTRQECFCRHFVATGNTAEAARRAGYAERSARQTGHALLERPHIVERVREIRLLWRETARQETQILLERLEQAWLVAVAKESPFMMLQTIRLQADLSGLSRRSLPRRADLWPLPDEDEFGEMAAALEADGEGTDIAARPGPLAEAVRRRAGAGAPPADETPAGEPPASEEGRAESPAKDAAPETAADGEQRAAPVFHDDPPEDRYDGGDLMVPRTGPDLQEGDDIAIDASENGWMYALRCGHDPYDPWTEEELAVQAAETARIAALRPGIDTWEFDPAQSAPAGPPNGA